MLGSSIKILILIEHLQYGCCLNRSRWALLDRFISVSALNLPTTVWSLFAFCSQFFCISVLVLGMTMPCHQIQVEPLEKKSISQAQAQIGKNSTSPVRSERKEQYWRVYIPIKHYVNCMCSFVVYVVLFVCVSRIDQSHVIAKAEIM